MVLACDQEDRGEASKDLGEGTESLAAKRGTESPAIGEQLMEEVCERENCKQALKRVKANKGSPGVDRMTVQQLPEYLKEHWPAIREQLRSGCGPACPVVWEGRGREASPYADGVILCRGCDSPAALSSESRSPLSPSHAAVLTSSSS